MLPGCTPWPPDLAARYRERGYWRGETLGAHLRRWAEAWPEREALVAGDARVTYAQLDRRVDDRAHGLVAAGLRDRDRIVMHLGNTIEFFVLTFACYRAGVIPIMALPAHRETEIVHLARVGGARAYAVPASGTRFDYAGLGDTVAGAVAAIDRIFVDGDAPRGTRAIPLAQTVAHAAVTLPRVDPADVAHFLLSGGTTGLPKLIPRTHDDYAYNFRRSAEIAGFDARTRYLAALPIAHNFPLGSPGAYGVFENGGTVVLCEDPAADSAFPLVQRERITHTAVVPTIALRWLESPLLGAWDLRTLRVLQVGGARIPAEVARKVRPVLGCTLQQVFGMAEGLLNFTALDDPEETIVATQGTPMCPDDELRIVDDAFADAPPNEPGQLLVRGPYTLRGYFNAPEHNARAFTADGYYCSGDIVRRLPSGHLVVEGRAKDLINRGGEKISAEDVENILLAHPRVLDAAVVAMPDREFGERPCAYLVLRDGGRLALDDVRALFAERKVARFMTPERIEIVERFPLTNVGKVDKKALRADIAAKLARRVGA